MQKEEKIDQIKIFKVRIDNTTVESASKTAIKWAKEKKQRYITTPNPEILLHAKTNEEFLRVLNESDLNIADGTGILWAAKFKELIKNKKSKTTIVWTFCYSLILALVNPKYIKTTLNERVTGVDLMESICKKSRKDKIKIFLLGAEEGIAEKTKEKLKEKYEKIKISGSYAGSPKEEEETKIIKRINNSNAKILFVAYGAPKQEIWINKNLKKLNTVKLAIGIGGSFDFLAEEKQRAPKWMQKTGIEWIYRLIQEPKRIKRIYNAVIKFPITILKEKLKK